MTIQVWDYRAEYEDERDEILAAVDQAMRSGRLILGESVRAFEQEFSTYCGVRLGIGVNSGTDALTLALRALDVEPGDEVITTSNTAIPTVSAIVSAGATPRFVDIEAGTYLMDVSQLEEAMTSRTRCIIPVHLFGQCVDMDGLQAVAGRHGIPILEDCAQSTGAEHRRRRAGSMSRVAAFSFYPTKILGAYGDGGMIVTSDDALAARLRRLRVYGTDKTYYAEEHGCNSRLDEIQAEILRRKLRRIEAYIERRRVLARGYDEQLRGTGLILPTTRPENRHVYHLYVVRHPARDAIIGGLAAHDIIAGIHYPWPIHTMPAYAHLGYGEGSLPVAEQAAREIFSLPMYPSLTDAQQDRVCGALRDTLSGLEAQSSI
ncbi:MAG: DegT/DnrJ/EryC1/StrS family aminotransferase [Acidobacteria bacterium]|nr:DegT/DnrJ/EryC1/StrS family aminotransferase [Acidobacteriota bacterium]